MAGPKTPRKRKATRKDKRPIVSLSKEIPHITSCWVSYGARLPVLSWGPDEPSKERVLRAYSERGFLTSDVEIAEAEVVR